MSRSNGALLIWLLTALLWPDTAYAYLDPGIGSMLFQGVIAVVGATAATLGLYWRSVTELGRRVFGRRTGSRADDSSKR